MTVPRRIIEAAAELRQRGLISIHIGSARKGSFFRQVEMDTLEQNLIEILGERWMPYQLEKAIRILRRIYNVREVKRPLGEIFRGIDSKFINEVDNRLADLYPQM